MTDLQKKQIYEWQKKWINENAPFGMQLGYPKCCIKNFCLFPPEVLKLYKPDKALFDEMNLCYTASFIDGKYTGFIPCVKHAKMIHAGKITLASLIKNRNPIFNAFPNL